MKSKPLRQALHVFFWTLCLLVNAVATGLHVRDGSYGHVLLSCAGAVGSFLMLYAELKEDV